MERVYLDMCSLKRPFDDQRQPRVRDEAMAVADIMARAEAGELHVAFAERAGARWFVTCDDDLLRRAGRLGDALRTLVVAPRVLPARAEP